MGIQKELIRIWDVQARSSGAGTPVRPLHWLMTKRHAALAACGVVLMTVAGESAAAPALHTTGGPSPSAGPVVEARAALDDNLLDYRATRFRRVRLVQTKLGYQAFCGELNTPNRMGGFSGWTPFVLPLGDSDLAKTMDRPTIQGQPTKIDVFLAKYGPGQNPNRDSSARIIASECGETAQSVDAVDYAGALTFQ